MVKINTAKLVRLSNRRTIYPQYKRTRHSKLLANLKLERVLRQRAVPRGQRRQPRQVANQQGQRIGKFFKMAKKLQRVKLLKT